MKKNRHLTRIVAVLMMAASTVAGQQVNTTKPGEQVERQLSSDQTFREWSLKNEPSTTDDGTSDIKRIKVCRVDELCKMRFMEGKTPRTRVKNLVAPLRYEGE